MEGLWRGAVLAGGLLAGGASMAQAALDPQALVRQVSADVIEGVRADARARVGDTAAVMAMVDARVVPHVDVARLTALAMGRHWSAASPEQRRALQLEFKTLLVRSYAGAVSQANERSSVDVRPLRILADDGEALVSTRVRGHGEPIDISYRLHRDDEGWRIYDISILGVWLAENHRNSLAQEIRERGLDGLIASLAARNRAAAERR